jgi:hypothetical protein
MSDPASAYPAPTPAVDPATGQPYPTTTGDPVIEPQAAAGAWPVPPTQGQPALGTADAAAATALFAYLLPQAMAGFVQYILSRSPATFQDAMIAKIAATTVP